MKNQWLLFRIFLVEKFGALLGVGIRVREDCMMRALGMDITQGVQVTASSIT